MRTRRTDLGRSNILPALLGIFFWLIALIGLPLLIVLLAGTRHR